MMPVQPPQQAQPLPQQAGPPQQPPVTIEQVREYFDYDPETGVLKWKCRSDQSKDWNSRWAGKIAGADSHGYRAISIGRQRYRVHRIIWLLMTGEWPKHHIDHIDMDRSNNRWANLREADWAENNANRRGHRDSRTGVKGVTWHAQRGKYYARINVGKKQISLGLYGRIEDAAAAYARGAEKYHGEFARTA
jgi:hypothetical protein